MSLTFQLGHRLHPGGPGKHVTWICSTPRSRSPLEADLLQRGVKVPIDVDEHGGSQNGHYRLAHYRIGDHEAYIWVVADAVECLTDALIADKKAG